MLASFVAAFIGLA